MMMLKLNAVPKSESEKAEPSAKNHKTNVNVGYMGIHLPCEMGSKRYPMIGSTGRLSGKSSVSHSTISKRNHSMAMRKPAANKMEPH